MKRSLLILSFLVLACAKERELQLPEIEKADIAELQDVSAAYLFYDETQPDSVLLNRKNLISTTNWLINVDKRLTLKQAIPHIQFLQEKKKNSSHKNEKAKNYFTCHDLSKNNLGFLEFTDILYSSNSKNDIRSELPTEESYGYISLKSDEKIKFESYTQGNVSIENYNNIDDLIDEIEAYSTLGKMPLGLRLNANLSFQHYISLKSKLLELDSTVFTISKDEFIY